MNKYSKILLICATIFVFLPMFALAGGLVPCGGAGEPTCTICHIGVLINNIVQFLLFDLILPIAVVAMIIAGILLMTAHGEPQKITQGKNVFKFGVMGLLIAFSAWLIVKIIMVSLTGNEDWNNYGDCAPAVGQAACAPVGSSCGGEDQDPCCSGACISGTCAEKPPCIPTGGSCATPTECCSRQCTGDVCVGPPPFNNTISPELASLIECMRTVTNGVPSMTVTSTTDNNIPGRCDPTLSPPNETFRDSNNCQHSQYSCHYGGRSCVSKGSYAIDVATSPYDFAQVSNAAKNCARQQKPGSPYSAYAINEGNHFHVSIGAMYDCGCN